MSSAPLPLDGTVAVVGGSLAGLRAAQGLREGGFRGRLVLVGEERHPPYDRPPLSKQVLAGKWPPERAVLAGPEELDDLGVKAYLGRRAEHLDAEARRVTLDDGTVVEADGIVVATGARPRRLPRGRLAPGETAPGANPAPHDTAVLRTLDDAVSLRDRVQEGGPGCRVVVVGAGFIGSEVAATCAGLGCDVTVLEALTTPLAPALGELIGAACGALHVRHGVDLRTGAVVAAVRPGAVDLGDGASIPADVVVVGIGVTPNVEWLEGSGLTVADGVVCDPALFAADGVVAAGDLARWPWRGAGTAPGVDPGDGDGTFDRTVRIEHWEVASQMGAAAARSLLAGRAAAAPFDPVPYFWSDQYGLRIQVLGRPEPRDEVAVVDGSLDAPDSKFVAIYGRGGRLTAALAVSRPRQLMAFRPLLVAGASWDEALRVLEAP